MQRRDFIASVGAGLALAPAAGWSQDAYPARPVKLIVPFPPGGPTDIMGRTAAKAMGDALGQSFVVENKAGAGGNIGTDAVAKAAPDGYTIGLSAISSLAIAPYLYDKLPFQVEKDFAPISLVGTTPCVIVVHPSAPFADLKGLVAYAKANPGKLGYATSGIGTSNHLAAELLQSVAGIELTNIPYKGSSQIVPDLLSGTVIMSMESSLATTLQHIRSGKLKALAVTSPTRAKALPDVPTVAESGYPGFAVETWFGLVAPAATPAAVVQKLHDAWAKGAKTAEAQAAFDNISGNLRVTTPQEFDAFIKAENNRWGALIRKLDIKAN
ncbi:MULTISPECIES: Bug family tripartite tricarboxylate transporter substrate binding protein [Burkholderiales]|jgi:tripartite-type tricarboxylate transporter receptor subunit TctC|uniref:CadM n=9 Tax=root TaxID=1 RepID=G9C9X0_COMTE|nr:MULTISPECIES: tripartite tricarboxylate transporter substrate binding protein [Burkholderiales]ABI20722.1 putative exported protein [Delftia sp. AN3]EKS72235.1 tricarboxylate binding receptor [Burkholderia sp. SJ98]MCF8204939.1 tripartite tricarboxylate transporter substrate binding protein [Methylotenera sp.]MDP2262976.1 tripartite tricarboxylate transporter substrate binding protein [Hydrogenophaga sp.]QDL88980.1 putative exported protein [Sym plasmid]BAH90207.1 twin-arginine translocati